MNKPLPKKGKYAFDSSKQNKLTAAIFFWTTPFTKLFLVQMFA